MVDKYSENVLDKWLYQSEAFWFSKNLRGAYAKPSGGMPKHGGMPFSKMMKAWGVGTTEKTKDRKSVVSKDNLKNAYPGSRVS